MKTYVILCETIHRAEWLCGYTASCLDHLVRYISKNPIYNIETHDGVLLYFTSYDMWYGRLERDGHHWEVVPEGKFEMALKVFWRNRKEK